MGSYSQVAVHRIPHDKGSSGSRSDHRWKIPKNIFNIITRVGQSPAFGEWQADVNVRWQQLNCASPCRAESVEPIPAVHELHLRALRPRAGPYKVSSLKINYQDISSAIRTYPLIGLEDGRRLLPGLRPLAYSPLLILYVMNQGVTMR